MINDVLVVSTGLMFHFMFIVHTVLSVPFKCYIKIQIASALRS